MKTILAVFGVCIALAAGAAAGVWVAGYIDLSNDEYNLKRIPLAENYSGPEQPDRPLLAGTAVDENGAPVEGVWVAVGRNGETDPFVRMETDENGRYAWLIEDKEAAYHLIFQKEGYVSVVMEPQRREESGVQSVSDPVILLPKDEGEEKLYPYSVEVRDVDLDGRSGEQNQYLKEDIWTDGQETGIGSLADAEVSVRPGLYWTGGDTETITKTDQNGTSSMKLKKGAYTVTIGKDGYNAETFTFYAGMGEETREVSCVKASGLEWQIVLSWQDLEENPVDLDSFASDGNRILNSLNRGDTEQGRYLFDSYGRTACEIIELPSFQQGSWKYYVMDYEAALSAEEGGSRLAESDPVVRVYQKGVLKATYTLPQKANEAVWVPFEIRDGRLADVQQTYEMLKSPVGWNEDKELARMDSKDLSDGVMVSDGEWLYFSNEQDGNKLYYINKDGTGLTKLSDDSLEGKGTKLLVGDWLYYCVGDDKGWGSAIYRIRTDGSGRELIRELEDGDWLRLLGAVDDRIFFWKRKDVGGEILYIDGSGEEKSLGAGLGSSISHVGHTVYYLNEAGYDGTAKGLHCYDLKTGEDTLVLPDAAWYQFFVKDGYFYYDEGMQVFRMKLDGEPELVGYGEESSVSGLIMYGDRLYYSSEGYIISSNLDGTDRKIIKTGTGWFDIIDGELYSDSIRYAPVLISGLDGENERELYDVTPYRRSAAAAAYNEFLASHDGAGTPEEPIHTSFACVDIDQDGVDELFFNTNQMGMNSDMIYHYNDGLSLLANLARDYKYGGAVVFEPDTGMMTTMYRYGEMAAPDEVTLYHMDGQYPREQASGCRYSEGWEQNTPEDIENAARFDEITAEHWNGKRQIAWVDNTAENRQLYILGCQSTGYGAVMSP